MINISKNKCIGCGICTTICPDGIKIKKGVAEIKDENIGCINNAILACPQKAIKDIKEKLIFAIGTDDHETIKSDDHVGMSKYFELFEYSNGKLTFKEERYNKKYKEDEIRIHGDSGKAKATTSVLGDVDVLVGKMMGPNIVKLRNKFVCIIIREPEIKKALKIINENINEIIDEKNKIERRGIILK